MVHTCSMWKRDRKREQRETSATNKQTKESMKKNESRKKESRYSPWEIDRNDKNFKRKFIKYFLHIRIKDPGSDNIHFI